MDPIPANIARRPPPPAGEVVVDVDVVRVAAPAAPSARAAPPARVLTAAASTRAGAPAPAPAAAPQQARGSAARRARAAAARKAWTRLVGRTVVAVGLVILGMAAAAFALFTMTISPATYASLQGPCAPTDAEAAALRATSKLLLLSAATQTLVAGAALLMPTRLLPISAALVTGFVTANHGSGVLWMLVSCHNHAQSAALGFHYFVFVAAVVTALVVCSEFGCSGDRDPSDE